MSMIAILISTKDPAGMNIKEHLLAEESWEKSEEIFDNHPVYQKNSTKMYTTDQSIITYEHVDKNIHADFFICPTKHQSQSGIPSLTCHTPGNWGEASFGGKEKFLCLSHARAQSFTYLLLKKNKEQSILHNFDVIMEATHHGPEIQSPIMFIEIGSTENEWSIPEAGKVIAKTIMELISFLPEISSQFQEIAIGIGGTHSCSNFTKVLVRNNIAIGHVCPKYSLPQLDINMIQQAIEKSNATMVLLDWKGLGSEKKRIVEMLHAAKIPFERTDQLK